MSSVVFLRECFSKECVTLCVVLDRPWEVLHVKIPYHSLLFRNKMIYYCTVYVQVHSTLHLYLL